MIEDCYKTKILPTAVQLKTADESSMSSLGRYCIWHRYTEKILPIVGIQINNYSYREKDHFQLTSGTVNSNITLHYWNLS